MYNKEYHKEYWKKNKDIIKEKRKLKSEENRQYLKQWRKDNKEHVSSEMKKWHKENPWSATHNQAMQRCYNSNCISYKSYGGRGIKCFLTVEDVKNLWFTDGAYNMVRPSIDRIDNNGDYELNNCQFIELSDNVRKSVSKRIMLRDDKGRYIKQLGCEV